VVKNSIIMNSVTIGENCVLDKAILAEGVQVGSDVQIGVGEEAENDFAPHIYAFGLATIGEKSVIPDGVTIGKNTAIIGSTTKDEYPDGCLASGSSIIKAGE
jgi:glucose-1-phosphate adenylyltransferase